MKVLRSQHLPGVLAAAVALLTFLVYLPALNNDFVDWDDGLVVFSNPHIRALNPAFLRWAFFEFYAYNWHPLTWISHALDYAVWGLDPRGHHLTSILLHAVNTFVVVLLARRLLQAPTSAGPGGTGSSAVTERAILVAAGTTGLLFGIHPLHVESVAWVSERKDLLCALFFLLAILAYAGYVRSLTRHTAPGTSALRALNGRYFLSLGCGALALLGKPMAVSLPLVLLIFDWYPFGRIRSRTALATVVAEKVPFFAMSLGAAVLTLLAQRSGGALQSLEYAPPATRLLVAARSLIAYLGKMLRPVGLVPFYRYPEAASPGSPAYLVPVLLVIAMTATCILIARRRHLWPAAWGYYVVTLLPVLGLVQAGEQAMADRYTYLPSLGPFLVAGLGLARVADRAGNVKRGHCLVKIAGGVVAIAACSALWSATAAQIGLWRNSLVLWNYGIEKEPGVAGSHYNRALSLGRLGRYREALEDLDRAIALQPHFGTAYINRGIYHEKLGLPERAMEDYDRGLEINPADYQAYFNRGLLHEQSGRLDRAIEDFTRGIALNPADYRLYRTRGEAYEKRRSYDRALADYDRALVLQPGDEAAFLQRGIVRGKSGLFAKAIEDFDRLLAMNPAAAGAYINRGVAHAGLGRHDRAMEDFNKALSLDRENALAYVDRGRLHEKTGGRDQALADYQKACDLGNADGCGAFRRLQTARR